MSGRNQSLKPLRQNVDVGLKEERQYRQFGCIDLLYAFPVELASSRIKLGLDPFDQRVQLRHRDGRVILCTVLVLARLLFEHAALQMLRQQIERIHGVVIECPAVTVDCKPFVALNIYLLYLPIHLRGGSPG